MSQITIGGTTLNFKDSAFTGDQWEQVASWVLNGGAEGIDANAQIATEKAAAASASAAAARNSATSAGESATAAANSASVASSDSNKAKKAAFDAQAAKNNAADSQTAAANSAASASSSATAAANSAASAAESIKHAPRINADGKWELWDATTNAYVATEYTSIGKDGTKWWAYNGFFVSQGEKILVSYHDIPNASIGDFVLHTRNDAGVVYEITGRDSLNYGEWLVEKRCVLKGTDGTTPHIGENGNWYIGDTDTGVSAGGSDLPTVTDADAGKYLHVNASTKKLEWSEAGDDTPLTKDSVVTALGYTPLNPSVNSATLEVNGSGLSLASAYSIGFDIIADVARMLISPVGRGDVMSPKPAVKFAGDAGQTTDLGTDKDVILTGIADGTEDNDAATVRQLKGYVASESPGWAGGDMLMMRDGEGFITYAEMKPDTVGAMPVVPVNDAAKGKYLHVNATTKALEWAEIGSASNYVLTDSDKEEIAAMVLSKMSGGSTGS